jgi:hypothetical protein
MEKYRAQARIIEALLASLILISATIIAYQYYTPEANSSLGNEQNIVSSTLGFIVENGYLKYIFKNPTVLIKVLYSLVPKEYGFKIFLYNESWAIIWSFQTADFTNKNEVTSILILNGINGNTTQFFILILAISKE